MKGIVRKPDELGRIVIPKEMRDNLGITDDTLIDISLKNNKIILEKYTDITCKKCSAVCEKTDRYCWYCGTKL